MASKAGLSQFEKDRLEKIERNRKVLDELGVKELVSALAPTPVTPKEPKVKAKKQRRSVDSPPSARPTRRSTRGQENSPDSEAAAAALAEDDNPAGRGYHKVVGISCHFCRQKKLCKVEDCPRCSKLDDMAECSGKSACSVCEGFNGIFCEPCLRSRYGLTLEEARNKSWVCPHCYEKDHPDEGWLCNSSFCMQSRGLPCTGIAIHDAKRAGFISVAHQIQAQIKGGEMRPLPLGQELPKSQGAGGGSANKRRRSSG